MSWVEKYIGVPYKNRGRDFNGFDCWGLFRTVYKEQLGVDLPILDGYTRSEDDQVVGGIVLDQISQTWEPVAEPQLYDGVVFKLAGFPSHVGIVLDKGTFIHTLKGRNTAVDRLSNIIWRNRIFGFYRYVGEPCQS